MKVEETSLLLSNPFESETFSRPYGLQNLCPYIVGKLPVGMQEILSKSKKVKSPGAHGPLDVAESACQKKEW
jgi:hypothetical protein